MHQEDGQTPRITDVRRYRCAPLARLERVTAQRDALLAACKALLSHFENDAEALDLYIENWPAVRLARAAIAQVEGESHRAPGGEIL